MTPLVSDEHDGPRGDWAYVSIVSVIPGLSIDVRLALLGQFLLFESVAVALAVGLDRVSALPAATAAILVTTAGSGLMLVLSDRIRHGNPPAAYRRLVFESSIDVLLGVVAFLALVTYLFVDSGRSTPGLLERLLGEPLPPPAVFFALVILWDLCYRIGTGWWASLTGLWRSVTFREDFDPETRAAYRRADLLTVVFAGLQLLLVPFLWPDLVLTAALLGHVIAVMVVSTAAILLLRR